MGSQAGLRDEVTVLVTGFGPFREQYPVNPSYEIARGLPSRLPPRRAKDPRARGGDVAGDDMPEVRIVVHPEPIRVSYERVREVVPGLWDGGAAAGPPPDMVLHIGMAGPRPFYQIERRGHRQGYRSKDVDGRVPFGEDEAERGPAWEWYGCPDELETELNMADVLERWRAHSPDGSDLRISDDAGHYLCDFIYYSSLSHRWRHQRDRKVTFLHVPAEASKQNVELGRELAVNLIRAMVESEVDGRKRRQADTRAE